MDFVITPKHTLALRMFGGQGNQVAPVGTLNPYFFEQGPIHVYNWSAVVNSVLTPRFTNQVLLGVNYFNQIFFDDNHSMNPISFGFNTGAAQPQLSGAPGIKITGFDNLQNATPPSGRNDITGQATDSASWVVGRHQFRFSGEYRRGYVNEFYHRKTRGNFSFPGTQGPWGYVAGTGFNSAPCQTQYGYTTPTAAQQAYVAKISAQANGSQILSLADFLIGCTQQAQIVRGNTERWVYVNNFSGSAADAFQLTPSLNVNYGLRYDYLGPMHDGLQDLSVFRPTTSRCRQWPRLPGRRRSARSSPGPSTTSAPASALPISRPSARVLSSAVVSACSLTSPTSIPSSTTARPTVARPVPKATQAALPRSPVSPTATSSSPRIRLLFPITTAYDPEHQLQPLLHQPQSPPRLYLQLQLQYREVPRLEGHLHLRLRRFAVAQAALKHRHQPGRSGQHPTRYSGPERNSSLRQAIPQLRHHQPGLQHRQLQLQLASDHAAHDQLASA